MPQTITSGQSPTAAYVEQQVLQGQRRIHESIYFGWHDALDELATVAEECRSPGWDGYGALPVEQETLRAAYCLIESFPLGTPLPTIGAEPDGHLTLEWYRTPSRTLSVSVSPEGDLHYAAILGTRKAYGTEPFYGDFPSTLQDFVRQVNA